ncbi:uncharacterized protein LOC117340080 [Pecten maximus]|uniref:uncharacterized protein LOC117340080 n=1 Tax=Pecten maximus TaxID=6579 RepID=UPI001457F86D|nr:uncharacterized protein LOC117340080 [Pecten maximus]
MATRDETPVAWKMLKDVIDERKNVQEMMTLQILSCNCFGGCHFTDAFVTTQEKLSMFSKLSPSGEKANGLYFQHVWDIPKLSRLIHEKQREEEDTSCIQSTKRPRLLSVEEKNAYVCLQTYLNDIDIHQNSLEKVLDGATACSKSDVVKVVDAHLFGPLSGGNCYIDNRMESSACSCGCGKQLKGGPTGLGVEYTWHGYADIFINQTVPVAVWSELEQPEPDSYIPDSEEQWQGLPSDIQEVEDKKVRDAFPETNPKSAACSRLMAQTITNAFAQVNQNEQLAGLAVPAFGCTPSNLMFYAYDCKNDVLLRKIFGVNFVHKQSLAEAAVLVWLHLNFTVFMKEDVTSIEAHPELENFKSKFCINDSIRSWYKNVKVGEKVTGLKHSSRNETHVELVTTRKVKID